MCAYTHAFIILFIYIHVYVCVYVFFFFECVFFCDPDLYSIFSARASLRDLEIRAWACDARRRYVCVWKGLASSISTSAVFLLVALNLLGVECRESF